MMYPYITLNDDTEITHSEMKENGSVKVYIETPDERDGILLRINKKQCAYNPSTV